MVAGQVVWTRQDGIACVSLNAPARMNAMSRQMWRQLAGIFQQLQHEVDLRCVVVSGAGEHFCAGGDISEYSSFRYQPASLRAFHEEEVWGGLQAMLDCDVPIVAQIRGNCMGAGVEIVCCCDIRLAAVNSCFGAPIARLGFPMAPREAALVLREAGAATARQWLLEAAVLDAQTMAQRGFVQHLVAQADINERAQQLAQRIASLAPRAARRNKQALRALYPLANQDNSQALASLLAQAYDYAAEAEHREGIEAFLEKRQPQFVAARASSH